MSNYVEQDGAKILACPWCGKPQEDTIVDHLIPNRQSVPQDHECYECSENFTVYKGDDNKYHVEQA